MKSKALLTIFTLVVSWLGLTIVLLFKTLV